MWWCMETRVLGEMIGFPQKQINEVIEMSEARKKTTDKVHKKKVIEVINYYLLIYFNFFVIFILFSIFVFWFSCVLSRRGLSWKSWKKFVLVFFTSVPIVRSPVREAVCIRRGLPASRLKNLHKHSTQVKSNIEFEFDKIDLHFSLSNAVLISIV